MVVVVMKFLRIMGKVESKTSSTIKFACVVLLIIIIRS
jgi:hypothetical protein